MTTSTSDELPRYKRAWGSIRLAWSYVVSHLGSVAVLVGSGLMAVPPIFADKEKAETVFWATVLVIIGALLAACGTLGQSRTIHGLRSKLKAAKSLARAEEAVAMRRLFHRNLERLEGLRKISAGSTSKDKRLAQYNPLVTGVVGGLKGFFEADGTPVKVNYYRLGQEESGYFLQVVDQTYDVSRPKLTVDQPESREIIRRTLNDESEYCDDLTVNDQFAIEKDRKRGYVCYASVAASVGGHVHGMLSVNTEVPDGIDPDLAIEYLEVFGMMLAIAESALGLSVPHEIGQPTGMSEVVGTVIPSRLGPIPGSGA